MTTDKLTNAIIAILEPVAPDGVSVVDARAQADIALPCIAVSVESPERHSAAMPGVLKCPVTVTLRANPGDGETRATLTTWADAMEQALNDPPVVRETITEGDFDLQCDFWIYEGCVTSWDETTFEATLSAEAWVVRTA